MSNINRKLLCKNIIALVWMFFQLLNVASFQEISISLKFLDNEKWNFSKYN
jgi:hypothetical protein